MKRTKIDIINKIMNILENYDKDIDNSNLIELNTVLVNNKVFDKTDIESWWYKSFSTIVNEVRMK